ncbi:MAG: hypothetical protein HQ581_29455 [Planctomycetes bacterium]|nr:hypothetical protein [Planctomycetota bacterium]
MNPELLDKIPAQSYEEAERLGQALVAGGAATVRELVAMVGDEFGDPDGAKPKYALHGLVMFAARPGADGPRKMVAETLAGELDGKHADELKAFICRQLQLCGRSQEIPALAKLLAGDRLCEPATQAILAIGGKTALVALGVALPGAQGKRRATIRQAMAILTE